MTEADDRTVKASFYHHTEAVTVQHGVRVREMLRLLRLVNPEKKAMFEIGAGNGKMIRLLRDFGYSAVGVEPSPEGVEVAKRLGAEVHAGSAYDDLRAQYGTFDVVYALEVIEHLYYPAQMIRSCRDLLNPGGCLILSTPYHGYSKNLLLAATGALDRHFDALQEHGHIKFWSKRSMGALLREGGFTNIRFSYVGRMYPFSTSFFACAVREGA